MTGYGFAEQDGFRVEIRSLNHRFMEINIRMPPDLLRYEIPLRNILRERFSRGKFDVTVTLLKEGSLRIGVDMNRAKELYNTLKKIKDELNLSGDIKVETLSAFRDMILIETLEYNINSLFDAFNRAVDNLKIMREEEGYNLKSDLEFRIDTLERLKEEIASFSSGQSLLIKEKLTERIKSLLGDVRLDEGRVLQEVAMLAEKTAIDEEITRISSHLGQVRKILSEGDTIGRRIEFILQELLREVNTISAKSTDYRISSILVDMKVEIEKMREQSQNIQ